MNILVADPIAKEGVQILQDAGFAMDVETELSFSELEEKIKDYDILIVRSETKVTKEILEYAEKLKLVARPGVGVDNIDVEYARKMGIAVMNAPAGASTAVAELTIGLMLSVLRNIAATDRALRRGEWNKSEFVGGELLGKTTGIIGFGRIGQLVAGLLRGFGCKLIVFDPFAIAEKIEEFGATRAQNLDDVYPSADIITLHIPLNEQTKNMIDKAAISKMKRDVIIINASRGGIINEHDLAEALSERKVGGAGIDTWMNEPVGDTPLLQFDNVVGTSHLGASTREAQKRAGIDIANQIVQAFKEHTLTNVVNHITTLKP